MQEKPKPQKLAPEEVERILADLRERTKNLDPRLLYEAGTSLS